MKEYQSTKRGKPIKRSRWSNLGLRFFGRDDQGVSVWQGNRESLKWGSTLLAVLGCVTATLGVGIGMIGHEWSPAVIMVPLGCIHLAISWWMKRHDAWLNGLATIREIAADIGVDPDQLDRWAAGFEAGQIKPRVILNGRPFYNPADFGEAGILLRAASAPAGEELLRSAESARTDDQLLLRVPTTVSTHTFETSNADSHVSIGEQT